MAAAAGLDITSRFPSVLFLGEWTANAAEEDGKST